MTTKEYETKCIDEMATALAFYRVGKDRQAEEHFKIAVTYALNVNHQLVEECTRAMADPYRYCLYH